MRQKYLRKSPDRNTSHKKLENPNEIKIYASASKKCIKIKIGFLQKVLK